MKDVYKDFNYSGEHLVDRLRAFRHHGVHVLGSFIFGLPSDRPETFELTAELAERSGVTFAQFVMLTPFPGTVDFAAWEKVDGVGPDAHRGDSAHAPLADSEGHAAQGVRAASDRCRPTTSGRARRACGIGSTAGATSGRAPHCVESLKSRIAFMLISKLYRQMYANTGIATDSARINRSATWARLIAKPLPEALHRQADAGAAGAARDRRRELRVGV